MTEGGAALAALIARWKEDPGGTYRSWFLWDERVKNFRSIRAFGRFLRVLRWLGGIAPRLAQGFAGRLVAPWRGKARPNPDRG